MRSIFHAPHFCPTYTIFFLAPLIMRHTSQDNERESRREGRIQGICKQAAALPLVPRGVQAAPKHAETVKPPPSQLDKINIRAALFRNFLSTPPRTVLENITIILLYTFCSLPHQSTYQRLNLMPPSLAAIATAAVLHCSWLQV